MRAATGWAGAIRDHDRPHHTVAARNARENQAATPSPPSPPPLHGDRRPTSGSAAGRRSLYPPSPSCATRAPRSPEHGNACTHLQVPEARQPACLLAGLTNPVTISHSVRFLALGGQTCGRSGRLCRVRESFRDVSRCHPSDRAPSNHGTVGRSTPVTAIPRRRRLFTL